MDGWSKGKLEPQEKVSVPACPCCLNSVRPPDLHCVGQGTFNQWMSLACVKVCSLRSAMHFYLPSLSRRMEWTAWHTVEQNYCCLILNGSYLFAVVANKIAVHGHKVTCLFIWFNMVRDAKAERMVCWGWVWFFGMKAKLMLTAAVCSFGSTSGSVFVVCCFF